MKYQECASCENQDNPELCHQCDDGEFYEEIVRELQFSPPETD